MPSTYYTFLIKKLNPVVIVWDYVQSLRAVSLLKLPTFILLSSFVGAIIGISLIVFRGRDKNIPIPFGPYLAIAGWIYLLWGTHITQLYFSFAGIQ